MEKMLKAAELAYVNAALGPPSQLYDKEIAEEALQRAERVMKWLRKTLGVKG